ncbi:CPBP family intramembrane metalloprotease [Candidatus Dependentiae bacterium]|nr:CPBP family intramembrane metalloprotease [Candidatus Dependentiae bacterium]
MISSLRRVTQLLDVMRPVFLSAFSIFLSFCLLQPIALWLNPSFTLLANRSAGKIAFTLVVIVHIIMLAATLPRSEWQQFLERTILFIKTRNWLRPFFGMFSLFALLHALLLYGLSYSPYVTSYAPSIKIIFEKTPALAFGFLATFFLAWTEEAIFRGTVIPLLRRGKLSTLNSVFLSALIFSLVHDITAPWHLLSCDLPLGIGLFLLGIMLAQLFIISNTLYIGMGAHAGLVFIKVFLRRIPCLAYTDHLPWWLHSDLRQSPLVHLAFILVIIGIFWHHRRLFFRSQK